MLLGLPLMPIMGRGIATRGGGVFTAEYQAVYDSMTNKPSAAVAGYQNDMVAALINKGFWNKMDAFYVFANETNANGEALINWKSPGQNTATLVNAPTFTPLEGFKGNGSSQYINTNFTPSIHGVNFTQNDAHVTAYIREAGGSGDFDVGAGDGVSQVILSRYFSTGVYGKLNNLDAMQDNTPDIGAVTASRIASNLGALYRNQTAVANSGIETTGACSQPIYVLAYNNNGGTPGYYSSSQISILSLGGGFDYNLEEQYRYHEILEAYMDANSRGGFFLAEYQSVYNSMTIKPSGEIASEQEKMVQSLVDGGVWNKLDLFYLLAQENNDNGEALINWKNPGTFDAVASGANTFTPFEGINGGGVGHLDTGYNPSVHATNLKLNDAILFVYDRTAGADNKYDAGCGDATNSLLLAANFNGDLFGRVNGANEIDVYNDPELEPAIYFVGRNAADSVVIGRNNYEIETESANNSVALPAANLFLLGFNINGTPGYLSTRQQSAVGVGAFLTSAEREILQSAIETYMDSNSKGIINHRFGQEVDNYDAIAAMTLSDNIVLAPGVHFTTQTGRFRIPWVVLTNDNVLIVGTDVRHGGSGDFSVTDIGIIRSLDYGATWETEQLVFENNGLTSLSRKNNSVVLVNRNTGRIFIFCNNIDDDVHETYYGSDITWDVDLIYKYSDDNGTTWSNEVSLNSLFGIETNLLMTGAGKNGITMNDGTIVITGHEMRHSANVEETGTDWGSRSCIIYSTDDGSTWNKSALVDALTNEASALESSNGTLLLLCRRWAPNSNARVFETSDLGQTWTEHESDRLPYGYICNRDFAKFTHNGVTKGLMTMPLNMSAREEVELLISDDFKTWKKFRQLNAGSAYGYTCIASNSAGKLFIVLEKSDGIHLYDMSNYASSIIA